MDALREQEGARASWSSCWQPVARCGGFGRRRRNVAASGDGGTTWRGREKPAGSGGRRASELEGQVVGLERQGAAGSTGAHRQGAAVSGAEQQRNREGGKREEDDEDFSVIFQKSKWCTVK
jgi:hypothetical protein